MRASILLLVALTLAAPAFAEFQTHTSTVEPMRTTRTERKFCRKGGLSPEYPQVDRIKCVEGDAADTPDHMHPACIVARAFTMDFDGATNKTVYWEFEADLAVNVELDAVAVICIDNKLPVDLRSINEFCVLEYRLAYVKPRHRGGGYWTWGSGRRTTDPGTYPLGYPWEYEHKA